MGAGAANGFVEYDPETEEFSLSPEQAMVFAVKDSPVYLAGAFDLVAAMIEDQPKVEASFRTGAGVRWGDTASCLFCATGAFQARLRQQYRAELASGAERRD